MHLGSVFTVLLKNSGSPEAQHFLVGSGDGVRVPTVAQSAQHETLAGWVSGLTSLSHGVDRQEGQEGDGRCRHAPSP